MLFDEGKRVYSPKLLGLIKDCPEDGTAGPSTGYMVNEIGTSRWYIEYRCPSDKDTFLVRSIDKDGLTRRIAKESAGNIVQRTVEKLFRRQDSNLLEEKIGSGCIKRGKKIYSEELLGLTAEFQRMERLAHLPKICISNSPKDKELFTAWSKKIDLLTKQITKESEGNIIQRTIKRVLDAHATHKKSQLGAGVS